MATHATSTSVIPFPNRAERTKPFITSQPCPLDPGCALLRTDYVEQAIRDAAAVPSHDLARYAAEALAHSHATTPSLRVALHLVAFLCLARALDGAGLRVADVIGGAA